MADPVAASIDVATQQMIQRSHELGIETAFDRAVTMKPCNIGAQGICCKNCSMGPCRLPLPKGGIEGEDTRKGICGATPNTIAARNFIRMIADGWGGSMLATDLQDVLFGTPYPVVSEANLGVMKEDMVNIVIHGHEPVLSEMIVAVVQTQEMQNYVTSKGAKGIQLSGQ